MKTSRLICMTALVSLMGLNVACAAASTSAMVKIPILTYHSVRPYYPGITNLVKEFTVPPDIFDEQIKYMGDNGFTAITPDDLTAYFASGRALPPKPYMVTLDDGWENQYRYAFPILQKYHIPGVFYVYKNTIGGKVFLTWDQLREMQAAGMIIGDHTETHPELTKTATADLSREIVGSKAAMEMEIGKKIDTFAYPYGKYDDRAISVVTRTYASARALNECVMQSKDILFTLCGVIITGDFNRFVATVNR